MSPPSSSKPSGPIAAAELIRRLAARREASSSEPRRPQAAQAPFPPVVPKFGAVRQGRFEGHGPGRLPGHPEWPSYYVEILTTEGRRRIWGSDLKRAIVESETNPKLTTMIGVQSVGYQELKFAKGRGPPELEGKTLKRARWRVERVEYFAALALESRRAREASLRGRDSRAPVAPPRPVKISLETARTFADRYMHHPHDREAFLRSVQDRIRIDPAPEERPKQRGKDHEPPTR